MKIFADLHMHSKYSRACSNDLTLENIEHWARKKGLGLVGTGDFTHPNWIKEIKKELKEDEKGIYRSKTGFPFVLQTELANIYTQDARGRKVHNILLAPSIEIVEQITEWLLTKGRVDYDGRPIFGISCVELAEKLKEISKDIEIIPAHAWTPWFSIFGSMSGFDSVEECFQDKANEIFALETGLSSDPAMNWRVSGLDNVALISSSDSHSHWPWRIGREATVFSMDKLNYSELIKSIRENKIAETLEFYPEEGKYHFDGHRACGTCFSPRESLALKKICPSCKSELTIGVANRVEELADKPEGRKPANARPFRNLIPLSEIISHIIHAPVASKKTWEEYMKLTATFGNEIAVLSTPFEELQKHTDEKIARAISGVSTVKWRPGFDGEYGVPLFEGESVKEVKLSKNPVLKSKQKGLGEF